MTWSRRIRAIITDNIGRPLVVRLKCQPRGGVKPGRQRRVGLGLLLAPEDLD